jgi:hypothetical protein
MGLLVEGGVALIPEAVLMQTGYGSQSAMLLRVGNGSVPSQPAQCCRPHPTDSSLVRQSLSSGRREGTDPFPGRGWAGYMVGSQSQPSPSAVTWPTPGKGKW